MTEKTSEYYEVTYDEKNNGTTTYIKNTDDSIKNIKRRFSIGKILSLVMIIISVGVLLGSAAIVFNQSTGSLSKITGDSRWNVFSGATKSLFNNNQSVLVGQNEGRTNFLLVGVDAGEVLTDTIIVMSYFYETNEVTTITIPRDLAVYESGEIKKINAVNFASGVDGLEKLIEEEFEIDLHYTATINFQALKDLVDKLGGISVDVENTFSGYYGFGEDGLCEEEGPFFIEDGMYCRYSFLEGQNLMNGKDALRYSRIRKVENRLSDANEGSDFARSRRQTIVIKSALSKLKEEVSKGNISVISSLLDVMGNNLTTSISTQEIIDAYQVLNKDYDPNKFYSYSLNSEMDELCPVSDSLGYRILLCDMSAIGGSRTKGFYQESLISIFNNPLKYTKYQNLSQADTIVLANTNLSTPARVAAELRDKGIRVCETCVADEYSFIDRNNSVKIQIMIEDEDVRNEFIEFVGDSLDFDYKILSEIPDNYTITANNQGVEIIVWME